MIYKNGHLVSGIYRGNIPVNAIYKGNRLIWQLETNNSCYSGEFWMDDMPWIDNDTWNF